MVFLGLSNVESNRPDHDRAVFYFTKEKELKHKDKLKSPKRKIDKGRILSIIAGARKRNHKQERIRDEFKHPSRSGLPEESWQISGQE